MRAGFIGGRMVGKVLFQDLGNLLASRLHRLRERRAQAVVSARMISAGPFLDPAPLRELCEADAHVPFAQAKRSCDLPLEPFIQRFPAPEARTRSAKRIAAT